MFQRQEDLFDSKFFLVDNKSDVRRIYSWGKYEEKLELIKRSLSFDDLIKGIYNEEKVENSKLYSRI